LLSQVQAAERQHASGKLRIFLGYAAGVGKTYAMLEAAQQRRAEGLDVVIGYVETHGRRETAALLEGLEPVARRAVDNRGAHLTEMDVDAVLARHPQLAVVDELAHTNAPGSRHPKRFQDVEELLHAGIDVYTALNVQHLESLNDVVAQITGVTVRETVPDRLIDEAAEIILVDLPPDELRQRLQAGKVYVPEQASRAIERFFRPGNLTALREATLRRAAERVDDQMRDYMQTRAIPGPWPASERLLVGVSASPLSERLVRSARRLADDLNAEWFAIHVEPLAGARASPAEQDRVARVLHLAEELGAKPLTLPGQTVVPVLLDFARAHNVTKLVVGKPLRSRWHDLLHGSVVEQLIRASGAIDVHVVSGVPARAKAPAEQAWVPHRPWDRYLKSALLVIIMTVIGLPLRLVLSPTNVVMLFLAAVVYAAVAWGRGPAILASFLGVLAFDYFYVPPHLTLAVADTEYILTFIGLFVVGLVVSTLAAQARDQAEAARSRALQTGELYDLSRDLTVASELDDLLSVLRQHVEQTFNRQAVIFMPAADQLVIRSASPGLVLDDNEVAVADWAFRHGQVAGRSTSTLPAARLRYLPLLTARGIRGVLGVQAPPPPDRPLQPEQVRLLEAFASQGALAIERAQLAQQAQHAEVLQATEKLQTALLNSISHDLRTPLVSITGALSSLQEDSDLLDGQARRVLVDNAREEAERLNRLVGNLLDMTRLEAGAMRVQRQPVEVADLAGTALQQLAARLDGRPVTLTVPEDLPSIGADYVLMLQVLMNLLDNALKYSSPGSPIEVSARAAAGQVEIDVADRGAGIPPDDLARVFDKFYRVQRSGNATGTGLGLSICRGIVEAHGGQLWAENRAGGGTVFRIQLPAASAEDGVHD
jgi:two-component system, OmpR family, sensor histidine kinase KdpD